MRISVRRRFYSTNELAKALSNDRTVYPPQRVKTTLERLREELATLIGIGFRVCLRQQVVIDCVH